MENNPSRQVAPQGKMTPPYTLILRNWPIPSHRYSTYNCTRKYYYRDLILFVPFILVISLKKTGEINWKIIFWKRNSRTFSFRRFESPKNAIKNLKKFYSLYLDGVVSNIGLPLNFLWFWMVFEIHAFL